MPYKLKINNEIMISEAPFKIGNTEAKEITKKEYEKIEKEKQALREKEERKQEILLKLNEIDNKSIRVLRTNDSERLDDLEAQAEILREELRKL